MQQKSIANEYRPVKFSEYLGQGNNQAGNVDFIKQLIANNYHYQNRALLICGPPGCGKTTLASLYYKATLCLNRQPGEYEPCGECDVCLGKNTSNIYHYTISSNAEAKENIERLIKESYSLPIKTSERKDNYRKFIIIDEAELASPEVLATLFDPLEDSPETTTWIIISMDIEKLELKDKAKAEALKSRCVVLSLNSLSQDDIYKKILERYPKLNPKAASILAADCKGNLRSLWNTLSKFIISKSVEDITEEFIYNSFYGGATDEKRKEFWNYLKEGKSKQVLNLLREWLSKTNNQKNLCGILINDIVDNLIGVNEQAQNLLLSLGRWMSSSHPYSLESVFISNLGCNIYPIKSSQSHIGLNTKDKGNNSDNKSKSKPLFFTLKLSEYYDFSH